MTLYWRISILKELFMKPHSPDKPAGSTKPVVDTSHLPLPEGVQMENDLQSLRISCSQFKPIVWPALAFGFFFIAGGIFLYTSGALAFVYLASLLMGLLLVYSSLAGLFNHLSILVTREQLKVLHGPLPFEKSHSLPSVEVTQLYTHPMALPTRYRDIGGFTLEAILHDGRLVPLLSDPSYGKVHFIEMQIESWLGIQDIVVPGEVSR
jgi:hypothetical protein